METMIYIHSAVLVGAIYYLVLLYTDVRNYIKSQDWFVHEIHALNKQIALMRAENLKNKVETVKKAALPKASKTQRKVKS